MDFSRLSYNSSWLAAPRRAHGSKSQRGVKMGVALLTAPPDVLASATLGSARLEILAPVGEMLPPETLQPWLR